MNPAPISTSTIAIGYDWLRQNMLEEGEFDKTVTRNGIEVWVTQMGDYMNMNTAFIDRRNGVVAIIDPFDSVRWAEELAREGLKPTHLLYTHTHRDHVVGYSSMIKLNPEVEVWGHEDARVPELVNHVVFERVDFTRTWKNSRNTSVEWDVGSISLIVTHSPGHAPGHVTIHGHGVYHAGDLLFTNGMGRVDLPGSNPGDQWSSIRHARSILESLPEDWRLIPGHRYGWIDGTTPDWVSIGDALSYNYALNDPLLDEL